jgi:two-component system OmpR family response regulator
MRLLIIEDDRESADYLVKAFREVGHVADLAGDGEEGLSLAQSGDYDVLVVDRMLPKRDGLSLIGALREKGNHTPVLILSALGQVDDRIKGLRAGGDDYLPKPYAFAELLARVEVLSRRHGGPAEETTYRVGDLELDRLSHRVARGKDELTLQPREFRLGLSFRSADQRDRRAYFAAAVQDRQGFRAAAAPYHSRRRVYDP